ncbi:hypothetical protein EYF80_019801 [Liparis tanakae]|uniref:Uncharacterized protein n=1 Tax=Liparis tanakae TaxID=230148 RepID=A0A4Z2HW70_9TELE|nr:hypothetical protein EYF80_019801 [Liparis tanakae]
MACGAALAAVYSGLIHRLQDEGNRSGGLVFALSDDAWPRPRAPQPAAAPEQVLQHHGHAADAPTSDLLKDFRDPD